MNLSAQNGLTLYPLPSGFSLPQTALRNDLKIDNSDNIWVAFEKIGLARFDGTSWTVYNDTNSAFPGFNANAIAVDNSGNVWCAANKGLVKFDGTTFTVFDSLNSPLQVSIITAVSLNGNDLWIGTNKGAVKFDGVTWSNFNKSNSGIIDDSITCFGFGLNNEIWIGTRHGLSKFYNALWTSYDSLNSSLSANYISGVLADGNNNLWITCGNLTGNRYLNLFNGTGFIDYVSQLYTGALPITIPMSAIVKDNQGKIYGYFAHLYTTALTNLNSQTEIYNFTVGNASTGFGLAFDSGNYLWGISKLIGGLGKFLKADYYSLASPFLTNNNFKNIDINDVKAGIMNFGMMHWDLVNAKFEVPKGSSKHSVFASGLWIGGKDQAGQLHVAAQTYRQTGNDFWPGPIDTVSGVADSASVLPYNYIWKVNRFDVEDFKYNFVNGNVGNGTYIIPYDMLNWPAHGSGNISRNLLPYIDFNNDGIYNPFDGDYPQIKGDQMLCWIFNDNLSAHTETGGLPLGLEIHACAYAYTCPNIADSNSVINTTTLYQYRIINRSNNDYDSLFIGLWCDKDLGNAVDDYVGCDSALFAGFVYNGDNNDDGSFGYGLNPPMQNVQILKGPEPVLNDGIDNNHDGVIDEPGEICMMNHFHPYLGFSIFDNPHTPIEFYYYLHSKWLDGSPVTYGGIGNDPGNPPTSFMFSGIPYSGTGWTEFSVGNPGGDRRFVMSSGPFSFTSGAETTIDFAYVFTWDSTGPNGLNTSIARNIADLQRVKYWFDTDSFPSCLPLNIGMAENIFGNNFSVYPNPVRDKLFIKSEKEFLSKCTFEITDVTGRIQLSGKLRNETIDVRKLERGIYFIRLKNQKHILSQKFLKL